MLDALRNPAVATPIRRCGPLFAAIAGVVCVALAAGGSSTAASVPAPRFGHSVDIGLISGVVIVTPPMRASFRLGVQDRSIPVGSSLDTTHGAVDLRSANGPPSGSTHGSGVQDGHFSSGLFEVQQPRSQGGVTILDLETTLNTSRVCAAQPKTRAATARTSPRVLALLRAKVHGSFRTRGRYSAATARGTQWEMIDRCDGTLTQVFSGTVIVDDFRLHHNVAVSAGHSYLAAAP